MLREFDCVRIKKNGMIGRIVDIRNTDMIYYMVEICVDGKNGEELWELHDCTADDIEPAELEE